MKSILWIWVYMSVGATWQQIDSLFISGPGLALPCMSKVPYYIQERMKNFQEKVKIFHFPWH